MNRTITTILRERVTIVRETTNDEPEPPLAPEFTRELPALFERPRRQPKRISQRPVLLLAAPKAVA